MERITREVQLLKSLDSEYFPKNYEFLVDPAQREFLIAEEFLDCQTLADARSSFDTEPKIIELLRHLAMGMKLVWDKRVVHRDLKPANILVTASLIPRIIDFGIARFLEESSLTATAAMRGPATLAYASPEQLSNRKTVIDMRSDFFNLGIICLDLRLGFHPFDPHRLGNNLSIPENILKGKYVSPSSVTSTSPKFESLTKRLLEREPYLRFRNHAVLLEFLENNWPRSK